MDDLLQKYNDYIRLKNCRAEYLLSNGMIIDFTYKEENFIHLLGLHKLTDMYIKGQTIVKVKSFTLYTPDNQIIVTDSF